MSKEKRLFDEVFNGKVVLVAGASMGIGLAVAKGFSQAGAELAILAENDAIHQAAAEISAVAKPPLHVFQCDISDHAKVKESIAKLEHIDILVNVAGYQPMTPITDPDPGVDEDFRRCIDINVTGTWYVTREAIKRMGRGGRIIFTSSIWGKTAAANFSAYVASKHATLGMMRSLSLELGPRGINVNAVCPGWVKTEGAMWTMRMEAEAAGTSLDDFVEQVTSHLPIKGFMEPDALVPSFLFLASALADDIVGQALNVDRGHWFS